MYHHLKHQVSDWPPQPWPLRQSQQNSLTQAGAPVRQKPMVQARLYH